MKNKKIYITTIVFILSLMSLWSSNLPFTKSIEGTISDTSTKFIVPLTNFFSSISNPITNYQKIDKIKIKNVALKSKIAELEVHNIELQEKISLLESFTKIDSSQFKNKAIISANVIIADIMLNRKILQLNQGAKNEVAIGMVVVGQSGALVGIITSLYENYSYVTLINDNKSSVPVFLQSAKKAGALQGGNDSLNIGFISADYTVKPGDNIITSSLGNTLPSGIPVGRVYEVNKNELFLTIVVEPFEDLNNLTSVNIIKDS